MYIHTYIQVCAYTYEHIYVYVYININALSFIDKYNIRTRMNPKPVAQTSTKPPDLTRIRILLNSLNNYQ